MKKEKDKKARKERKKNNKLTEWHAAPPYPEKSN